MDKVTFDFENDEFVLMTDSGEVHEHLPGLGMRKPEILSAAGIIQIDLSSMRELLEDLITGRIDQEEFTARTEEMITDSIKSEFHNSLN
ncbi:MAG: hypothetical protein E7190_06715 [Erysipelotrichaceae bacterium]|nr:hypothetical protein [Erysipelotrichaceae bacterium]